MLGQHTDYATPISDDEFTRWHHSPVT